MQWTNVFSIVSNGQLAHCTVARLLFVSFSHWMFSLGADSNEGWGGMSKLSFSFAIRRGDDGHYVRVSQINENGDSLPIHEVGPIPDRETASKVREEQISLVKSSLEQANAGQLEHLTALRSTD